MINKLRKGKLLPVLAILAVALVTFGIYLPQIGFYLDDWPNLFFQTANGNAGTILFHAVDTRPLSGWFYLPLFATLGYNALAWQIFTFTARVLTVIFFWLVFNQIWPKQRVLVTLAALLFLVYPQFMQQPISLTFSAHWFSFLCIVATFYLMILATQKPRWAIPLTLLGLILNGVGFVLEEFFVGLELFRPILLWLYSKNVSSDPKKRRLYVIKMWAPYLAVWVAFVVWREFFIQLPISRDRNYVKLFQLLAQSPVKNFKPGPVQPARPGSHGLLYLVGCFRSLDDRFHFPGADSGPGLIHPGGNWGVLF